MSATKLTAAQIHDGEHPHAVGCSLCREERRCDVCGTTENMPYCTNGRCPRCHARQCTSGGGTYPGHGFGPQDEVGRAALRGDK